jgi:hypothetical protein
MTGPAALRVRVRAPGRRAAAVALQCPRDDLRRKRSADAVLHPAGPLSGVPPRPRRGTRRVEASATWRATRRRRRDRRVRRGAAGPRRGLADARSRSEGAPVVIRTFIGSVRNCPTPDGRRAVALWPRLRATSATEPRGERRLNPCPVCGEPHRAKIEWRVVTLWSEATRPGMIDVSEDDLATCSAPGCAAPVEWGDRCARHG